MATHDIGRHIVELHEIGMLAITGEGTRITLSPHEALDLYKWLHQHENALHEAAKAHDKQEEAEVEILQEEVQEATDRDAPIDEE